MITTTKIMDWIDSMKYIIYGIGRLMLICVVISFLTGLNLLMAFLIYTALENGMRSIYRTNKLVARCETLEARVKKLEQTTW